jgi:hypothetical protein
MSRAAMRLHSTTARRLSWLHAVTGLALWAGTAVGGDYTTLSINSVPANGPVVLTNSITIGSNQVAQIVAYPGRMAIPPSGDLTGGYTIDVENQGIAYAYGGASVSGYDWREITPVAGPVTIRLRANNSAVPTSAYCTVRVTPEAFSPEKTVVVVPGSGGANVTLECSTNLAEWSAATNGVYEGLSVARFFRINLNRAGFVPPVPPDGSVASQVDAQTTTLFVKTTSGFDGHAELSINEYQSAEIVAVGPRQGRLELWRGSQHFQFGFGNDAIWKDWSPVRGPAIFKLDGGEAYCTIRVFSEQYPPDKTLITLPGTNSHAVTLEGSTNLVQWVTATNGTYIVPQAMFFRIRSESATPP